MNCLLTLFFLRSLCTRTLSSWHWMKWRSDKAEDKSESFSVKRTECRELSLDFGLLRWFKASL